MVSPEFGHLKPRFHHAVRISSVRYALERLFLPFHYQKLWMVPTESFCTILCLVWGVGSCGILGAL